MKSLRSSWRGFLMICLYACTWQVQAASSATHAPEVISHGNFACAPIYRPTGDVRGVVLMLADSSQSKTTASCNTQHTVFSDFDNKIAQGLMREGMMVAGVDLGPLIRAQVQGGNCIGFDGDLENFSRVLQARYQLPIYHAPILIGSRRAATFVVSQLAAANKRTYTGGVSFVYDAHIDLRLPFCKGRDLITQPPSFDDRAPQTKTSKVVPRLVNYHIQASSTLGARWVNIPEVDGKIGTEDVITEGINAVKQLLVHEKATAIPPAAVADLPLIEVPAALAKPAERTPGMPVVNDVLAIMLSGDGGWAGIDRDLAKIMSRSGVPVIGFDSLRYFWKERTPESTTRDIERVIRYYQSQAQWRRAKIQLIGYSQGADVLPFILNRLSADVRSQVTSVVLLGLGKRAAFEFHVTNWVSSVSDGLPTTPEVLKMPTGLGVCIYGLKDAESVCPALKAMHAPLRMIGMPGDHHFDGAYDTLAAKILKSED
jgi:type IV secretory pathway VirJ component